MTEQNLLDYNLLQLTEIHNHNNNLSFNFFTEAPKALLNADSLFCLPPIVEQQEEKVLDQSKQQWNNDVSQPALIMDDDKIDRPSTPKVIIKANSNKNAIQSGDQTLTHIVSPEAILEALQEEEEESMGHKPFLKFSSFNALKERRYSTEIIPPNETTAQEDEPTTQQHVKLKRPPNAYLLFNRDMRKKLLKSCGKMSVAEISKEIGDSWKTLPADQREYYVKTASKLKEEHLQKYPGYIYSRRSKAQLAEDKRLGKRSKAEKINYHYEYPDTVVVSSNNTKKRPRKFVPKDGNTQQRDPRGRKKKRTSHPFAPKHPMSAYLYYVASVYQQVSSNFPGSTVGPISKSISKTWHAMSPEERLPWTQKAESDKARYAREMQIYMANNENPAKQQDNLISSDEEDVDAHTLEAVVNMVNNSPNGNPMYYK